MKIIGKFVLLEQKEFESWLKIQNITRKITLIQQHHTFLPAYRQFKGTNHFELCAGMERSHLERGFAEIAQNFTTFPDGTIMACRNMNSIPAGIKGANSTGICIENLGNFDAGKDTMTLKQRNCIITGTKALLIRFKLKPSENTVVYHHWYDLNLGKRITKEGTGTTKTCPGTDFFGGNTIPDFQHNFLPLLK